MHPKKITVKEMKQDRFRMTVLDTWRAFRAYLLHHVAKMAAGVGVVVVLLAAGWGVSSWLRAREAKAESLLGQALLLLPQEDPEGQAAGDPAAAVAKLEQLVAEYPRYKAADMGRYYMALALLRQGKTSEAGALLEGLLEKGPRHPLRPMALYALAEVRDGEGNVEGAESLLRQLVEEDHPELPGVVARLALAELLERNGKVREAYEEYAQVPEESTAHARARMKTDELRPLLPPAEPAASPAGAEAGGEIPAAGDPG
jgi:tetratricopeptide (TPR) repeat protein